MKIYYLRWPSREDFLIPEKGYIEIDYGVFPGEPSYAFIDSPGAVGLREIIAKKQGKIREDKVLGQVLELDDYEIQMPLENHTLEVDEKIVFRILEAKDNQERFRQKVEDLAGIICPVT